MLKKEAGNSKAQAREAHRIEHNTKSGSLEHSNPIDGRIRKLLLEYQEAEDVVNTLVSIMAGQSYDDHVPGLASVVVKGQVLRISLGYLSALKDAGVVQVVDAISKPSFFCYNTLIDIDKILCMEPAA